jgi:hypothetical protein
MPNYEGTAAQVPVPVPLISANKVTAFSQTENYLYQHMVEYCKCTCQQTTSFSPTDNSASLTAQTNRVRADRRRQRVSFKGHAAASCIASLLRASRSALLFNRTPRFSVLYGRAGCLRRLRQLHDKKTTGRRQYLVLSDIHCLYNTPEGFAQSKPVDLRRCLHKRNRLGRRSRTTVLLELLLSFML